MILIKLEDNLFQKALNDRYMFQGLQQIHYEVISEQRRKVLAAPISVNDTRAHFIAKNMFQRCINSSKTHGAVSVFTFLAYFFT